MPTLEIAIRDLLVGQVEASFESWEHGTAIDKVVNHAHPEAMEACKIDDLIDDGLRLFEIGRRRDVEFTRAVKSGQATFDPAEANRILGFYKWWLSPRHVARISKWIEKGYRYKRYHELTEAIDLANSVVTLSVDRLAQSFADRAQGKTVSLVSLLTPPPAAPIDPGVSLPKTDRNQP